MTRFGLLFYYFCLYFFTHANCENHYQIITRHLDEDFSENKYKPTWESLDSRPIPKWYDDVKFGIFLHWGVYSVPGFTEWFWAYWKGNKNSAEAEFINKTQPPGFSYQTYGSQFTAEFFNPTEWAKIFKQSGAKYVILTSKHHEGYTLWPSSRSFGWNSVDVGPHRDIVKELSTAIRSENMKFGLYYSLYEWFNRMYRSDKSNNFTTKTYVLEKMLPELLELVKDYHPDLIWPDGDWDATDEYFLTKEFLAWLFNESPVKNDVVIYDRWGHGIPCHHGGVYTCADRFDPQVLQPHKFESCMSVDKVSWGYRKTMNLQDVLSAKELIQILVRTVSCGGNLLLNVGPTMEGTISPIFQDRLYRIGEWLKFNGEAIYETKPWKLQNDTINNNVWYTASKKDDNVIYATLLEWPKEGPVLVEGLNLTSGTSNITMLENQEPLKWERHDRTTKIWLPNLSHLSLSEGWSLKITNPV